MDNTDNGSDKQRLEPPWRLEVAARLPPRSVSRGRRGSLTGLGAAVA